MNGVPGKKKYLSFLEVTNSANLFYYFYFLYLNNFSAHPYHITMLLVPIKHFQPFYLGFSTSIKSFYKIT